MALPFSSGAASVTKWQQSGRPFACRTVRWLAVRPLLVTIMFVFFLFSPMEVQLMSKQVRFFRIAKSADSSRLQGAPDAAICGIADAQENP